MRVDGDGRPDLAVVGGSEVGGCEGTHTLTFNPHIIDRALVGSTVSLTRVVVVPLPGHWWQVRVWSFPGANPTTSAVSWTLDSSFFYAQSVQIGDVNNDGLNDVVACSECPCRLGTSRPHGVTAVTTQ